MNGPDIKQIVSISHGWSSQDKIVEINLRGEQIIIGCIEIGGDQANACRLSNGLDGKAEVLTTGEFIYINMWMEGLSSSIGTKKG